MSEGCDVCIGGSYDGEQSGFSTASRVSELEREVDRLKASMFAAIEEAAAIGERSGLERAAEIADKVRKDSTSRTAENRYIRSFRAGEALAAAEIREIIRAAGKAGA